MDKIKCILVDDDLESLKLLRILLNKFCKDILIMAECSSINETINSIEKFKPDLIFLDIELNGEFGFDLFKTYKNPEFQVIFTTSHQEYSLRAIKISCLDYILKPIDPLDLIEAIDKFKRYGNRSKAIPSLIENLNEKKEIKKIIISHQNEFRFIDLIEIIALKADGKYTEFYLLNGERIISSENLGEYEKMLGEGVFFRCHKSWLVNLMHIKKFIKDDNLLILANDLQAMVSFRIKSEFLKKLQNFS
ncbi:MAG: LytR/AlgR family response regulator transcription factor [Sphingobacteriaceae bacterium]